MSFFLLSYDGGTLPLHFPLRRHLRPLASPFSIARPALIALRVIIYECWALIERSYSIELGGVIVLSLRSLIPAPNPAQSYLGFVSLLHNWS